LLRIVGNKDITGEGDLDFRVHVLLAVIELYDNVAIAFICVNRDTCDEQKYYRKQRRKERVSQADFHRAFLSSSWLGRRRVMVAMTFCNPAPNPESKRANRFNGLRRRSAFGSVAEQQTALQRSLHKNYCCGTKITQAIPSLRGGLIAGLQPLSKCAKIGANVSSPPMVAEGASPARGPLSRAA